MNTSESNKKTLMGDQQVEATRVRWESAISILESLYKDVERRRLTLPAFSLTPLAIGIWNALKWGVCLFLDFLILPMNLVILIRNFFPGRWQFRTFSGKYWRYVISWLWRGEAPVVPFVLISPLVKFMIAMHVHSRFKSINQHIYLDDSLSEEDITHLTKRASSVLEYWKKPNLVQVLFTYISPASGLALGVWNRFFPEGIPQWATYVGWILVSYAISFVISAFMFKRSLMLGASGREIFFPGAIPGNKLYEEERNALTSVGISTREWPLDIGLFFVSIAIAIAIVAIAIVAIAIAIAPIKLEIDFFELSPFIADVVLYLVLIFVVLFRRRKTERC